MEQKLYYSPDGKESRWYDSGKQPEGWTVEPVAEEIEGDVLPGDGDGTLKGYDPDDDQELEDLKAELAELEAEEAENGGSYQDPEAAA